MRTDRDGDIMMTGAKVSSEEARKGNLCFNCGKKGHFARNCRSRKESEKFKPRTETLKMVRRMPEEENIERLETDDQEKEQVDVSSIFQKLSLEDFDTSDSDEMLAKRDVNTENLNMEHLSRKSLEIKGQNRGKTFRVPGEQTDGLMCCDGTQTDITALRVNRRRVGNSTTVRKFTNRIDVRNGGIW